MSGIITAAVIAGGATLGAAAMQNNASKRAASAMREFDTVNPIEPNAPQIPDWKRTVLDALNFGQNNFGAAANLARMNNRANVVEAQRQYRSMQPYFDQLQRQLGQNALSYSQGNLPADVVQSIGKAAAQRGLQGGFGMGARGAGGGTALSSLNLRNLGLTSLDLSKFGSQLAMNAGIQAKQLSPGLTDPMSLLISPQQAVGYEYQNVGIQNEADRYWNMLQNRAMWDNTTAGNQANQNATNTMLAGQLASAQQVAQAGQQIGGAVGRYATNQYQTAAPQTVQGYDYSGNPQPYRLT